MKTSETVMKERNEFLEMDGLYFKSSTHEWFHDKSSTQYARKEDARGVSLKNIAAFIVREKFSGEYSRVLMDADTNQVIYDSPSMEAVGFYIDKLKTVKLFDGK
jgi:hypothetical protein